MLFHDYLKQLAAEGGSDLYLTTDAPPYAKFEGKLRALTPVGLRPGETKEIAYQLMDAQQQVIFERDLEMNLALSIPNAGRFRINIYMQRNQISIVARNIVLKIPNYKELHLPEVLAETVMAERGLILIVGQAGVGKSTSLAALVDHRNANSAGNIITIEDPIEYVHPHKKSIVTQREVGVDTRSFHSALKNALRQSPDVILIGEIRDRETMESALTFSETGHLVLSTLHAKNTSQALDRIINFFPEERRPQLSIDLSNNLRAIASQRLVQSKDGGRVAAVEILVNSPTISEIIARGDFNNIKDIMEKSEYLGMQTFDDALVKLYQKNLITKENAVRHADSSNNVRLKIKLLEGDETKTHEELTLLINNDRHFER